jgi:hypothetical protein
MGYTHEHCLCEWIKRKINFKLKFKVRCEVCDEPFDYKISKKLSLSFDHLKLNYTRFYVTYRCFFIVMAILILIWLALVVVVGVGSSETYNGWIKNNLMSAPQSSIIYISVIIVYVLILTFVILLFLAEYGIKT